MKKKLILLFLAVIAVCACVLALSACSSTENSGDNLGSNYDSNEVQPEGGGNSGNSDIDNPNDDSEPEHSHSFVSYVYNNNATCVTDGTETSKCEYCDETDTRTKLNSANGIHVFEEYYYNHDETCGVDGTETAKCNNCDKTDTRQKANTASGTHNMSDYVITKEPTKEFTGVKTSKCTQCAFFDEQSIQTISYDYTEGLGYKLNSDGTGYIVSAAYESADSYVSQSNASVIAPHCVYNGLPVVGINKIDSDGTSLIYPDGSIKKSFPDTSKYIYKLIIPASVVDISLAWSRYPNLANIEVVDDNEHYKSINGVLYNKNITTLVRFPIAKNLSYFTVPNTVETLADYAFNSCTLNTIKFPSELKHIGDVVFGNCDSLKNLVIPDSVVSMGAADAVELLNQGGTLYGNCVYLGSASNKYKILASARYYSVDITIHPDTEIIADAAFSGGFTPRNSIIDIPDNVKYIGRLAFATSAGSEEKILNIGRGVTYIAEDAFYTNSNYAFNATALNVSIDNPNYSSVDGVLFNKDKTQLLCYPRAKTITHYEIPNGVTTVGKYAFCGCRNLTDITIPDSMAVIGEYMFYNCTGLTNITIPDSITEIGKDAFAACSGLISVSIPDSVTSIGAFAFYLCRNLTNIVFDGTEEQWNAIAKGSWALPTGITVTFLK